MKPNRPRDELQTLLLGAVDDEEPLFLSPTDLAVLAIDDVPDGVRIKVGVVKEGVHEIEWDGELRVENKVVIASARQLHTRKYWYSPLGLFHYLDLVRRAIETRARTIGDVTLGEFDDDGAYVHLAYEATLGSVANLRQAYERALKLQHELEEAAEHAEDTVGKLVAETARRLSGWGDQPLEKLVSAVDTAKSTDDKGRALEELCARLFATINGFVVTGRLRTETEEIDLTVLNDSTDPRFKREEALLLVECKNWASKCGKNEFVIFKAKIDNRSERSSLGFLVSWNGFAETITKEMLRGSRERTLVVPLTGERIRRAVLGNSFAEELHAAWQDAVNT